MHFEVFQHKLINFLIAFVQLSLEIPVGYLATICQLDYQVQVVMSLIVDHLKKFGDVGMVELRPNFDLVLNFVIIIYHLHLAQGIVPDRSLRLQTWLMHNFHSELCNFDVIFFGVSDSILLVSVRKRATHYTLYFTEGALAYRIEDLKFVDEHVGVELFELDFVGVVHAGALFEEFLIGLGHVCFGYFFQVLPLLF